MNKKTVMSIIAVAMLLTVSLYFIGGTYARYIDTFTGNASVTIAKWNVALTDGGEPVSSTIDLTLEPEKTSNVVSGKIAPSITASGELELNLENTEVAVDVIAGVEEAQLADIFGGADAEVKVTIDGEDYTGGLSGTGKTISLVSDSAFTESNGKKTIKISIKWVNDDGNNSTDTAKGKAATGTPITIPVTVKVQQHIDGV